MTIARRPTYGAFCIALDPAVRPYIVKLAERHSVTMYELLNSREPAACKARRAAYLMLYEAGDSQRAIGLLFGRTQQAIADQIRKAKRERKKSEGR